MVELGYDVWSILMNLFDKELELTVFLKWARDNHKEDLFKVDPNHLLIEYFDRLPKVALV